MKSLKKLLALLVMISLTAALFANGGGEKGMATTDEFVEVTHHVMGNPPTNGQDKIVEEEWNKVLKASINTHMNLRWIEWADWYTKYNLLLASGEPLDLIHSSSTWLDMWPNSQKGAFLPLDDLIPQYAPETWVEIPQEDWDQARYDGKIVAFPENSYTQYVNHGFYYRGDWADEFGIDAVENYEDLGRYFQGIADNYPEVVPWDQNNGKTWGMHGWFMTKSDRILINLPTQYQLFMAKSFEDAYTLESIVFTDMFVDYAKTMKEWYDAGYWRKDALNYTGDTRENLKVGKSGTDQHHTQTFRFLRKEMDDMIPGSDLQFFAFSDTRGNLVAEPITHGGTSIGRMSKNPERSVMVYEQLRQNEEFYHLVNYGIEGVQYEIKDGVRVQPEGYNKDLDSFSSNYWGGRVDKFEIPSDQEWSGIGEVWAKFDKIINKPFPYSKFNFDKTMVEAELAAVSDVESQYLIPIMYGVVADPVQAVNDLRDALMKAGHDKLFAEIQSQLDAYKAEM